MMIGWFFYNAMIMMMMMIGWWLYDSDVMLLGYDDDMMMVIGW